MRSCRSASSRPPGSVLNSGGTPVGHGWVVHSIGSVEHADRQLLIVMLSDGRTSKDAGITVLEHIAQNAAPILAATQPASRGSG